MSTTKWVLDPTHSELGFKIKHLMISHVSGSFKNFEASVETEKDDFSTAKIDLTAEVNSIFTNNEQRDQHLHDSQRRGHIQPQQLRRLSINFDFERGPPRLRYPI